MATMKTVIYVGIAVSYGNQKICHVAVSHSGDGYRQHAVCGILGSEGQRLCAFDDHLKKAGDVTLSPYLTLRIKLVQVLLVPRHRLFTHLLSV